MWRKATAWLLILGLVSVGMPGVGYANTSVASSDQKDSSGVIPSMMTISQAQQPETLPSQMVIAQLAMAPQGPTQPVASEEAIRPVNYAIAGSPAIDAYPNPAELSGISSRDARPSSALSSPISAPQGWSPGLLSDRIVDTVLGARDSAVTVSVPGGVGGSGFIVQVNEAKGTALILTAAHVLPAPVGNGARIYLRDGTAFAIRQQDVIAQEVATDLALVRIQTGGARLRPLALAASAPRVGETIVAIGAPYGYRNSVASGIVSALDRAILMNGTNLTGMIQIDAPINPGNSGGPLLNLRGEAVGLVVALREGAQGISFSASAATIRDFLKRKGATVGAGEGGSPGLLSDPIVNTVLGARDSAVTVSAQEGGMVGSGFIVQVDEAKGTALILTAAHVLPAPVGNGARIYLRDGTAFAIRQQDVIAREYATDLALVRIQTGGARLRPLALAASAPRVGETIVAIGAPYGYRNSVASGIVSALDRAITTPLGYDFTGMIQVDAPVNPGNSGGPLLNLRGEAVGLVVALREGAQGISFSASAATIRDFLKRKGATIGAGEGGSLLFDPIVNTVLGARDSAVTVSVPRPGGRPLVGSGFIVQVDEAKGTALILTAAHVLPAPVGNGARIYLRDGTAFAIRQQDVIAREYATDLALVRIQTGGARLRPLALAASAPRVGETIVAIGAPFGYRNSVASGIVSALDRAITMPTGDNLTGLIQADAPVNPGNSGGPLLNLRGEAVGLIIALYEGAQGIGFSVSAATIRDFLKRKGGAIGAGVGVGEAISPDPIAWGGTPVTPPLIITTPPPVTVATSPSTATTTSVGVRPVSHENPALTAGTRLNQITSQASELPPSTTRVLTQSVVTTATMQLMVSHATRESAFRAQSAALDLRDLLWVMGHRVHVMGLDPRILHHPVEHQEWLRLERWMGHLRGEAERAARGEEFHFTFDNRRVM